MALSTTDLRPYQQDLINVVRAELRSSADATALVQMATAGGKSLSAACLVHQILQVSPKFTCIILVHRLTLASQLEETFKDVLGQDIVGVYCASLERYELRPVTIATFQSLYRLDAHSRDMVIFDEAHRFATLEAPLRWLKKMQGVNPFIRVVGFTATPFTNDGYIFGPGKLFTRICFSKGIRELTEDGYLCPARVVGASKQTAFDLSKLKVVGGDYSEQDLRALSEDEKKMELQIDHVLTNSADCKKILWCCMGIKHAEKVHAALTARGELSSLIHSQVDDEYSEILHDFKHDTRHLVFVTVVSEGFDEPQADCLVFLRPTRSANFMVQCVGRVLRIHPNKTSALIFDFGDVLKNCGPIDDPYIVGTKNVTKTQSNKKREEVVENYCVQCQECGTLNIVPKTFNTEHLICSFCVKPLPMPSSIVSSEKKLRKVADSFAKIYSGRDGWNENRWFVVHSALKQDVKHRIGNFKIQSEFHYSSASGGTFMKRFDLPLTPQLTSYNINERNIWFGKVAHFKKWLKCILGDEVFEKNFTLDHLIAVHLSAPRFMPQYIFANERTGEIMGWHGTQDWRVG